MLVRAAFRSSRHSRHYLSSAIPGHLVGNFGLRFVKGPLFYSTSTSTSQSKTLKPSSFANPKDPKPTSTPLQSKEVPQEDIDDFEFTKLVNGKTDRQIAVTKRACDKLIKIAQEDKNPTTALRISVESGGCHGFQYNLSLTDVKKELSEHKDLLVFKRSDEGYDAFVILDDSSLEILQDSKVDYTKELIGSSFKVVDSPYTSTACGCGASFDFDFDKLEKTMAKRHNST
ncbi:uncharacterized protein PRCAT00002775001 [Priceomyces carsonii]|uniref:uncharacterized protein n=1 Tax=Priceomyces carsonii TaxID=28549 RepID=UPI002EDB9A35|nr:unnamed protein product [Priceomyces carsonii]